MPFREHGYMLFLNRKLYLATVKLQAERKLGRSYSAMLPFVEGLHVMGYLSDADYEVYKEKYSSGLDGNNPLTPTPIKQQETKANRDRQLNRHYEEILKQWDTLKEKTKLFHLKKAKEDKHLKFAREVLKLGSPQETETQKKKPCCKHLSKENGEFVCNWGPSPSGLQDVSLCGPDCEGYTEEASESD